MVVPYHLITVCGNIVFAARGSDICSFTSDLEHISTWRYPTKLQNGPSGPSPAPEGPPSKRRRLEAGQDDDMKDHESGDVAETESPTVGVKKQGREKNGNQDTAHQERPFIHALTATADNHHVVAITGSDKTLWVFEHDGAGNLEQLSQRVMPKRPCSIALTVDNQTILSADKFGDVYSVPLIPSASSTATPAPNSRSATPPITPAFKPQANEFTVHTKRNLKALENQKLGLKIKAADKPAEPTFEHTLLLGHVSMLTAVAVGVHPTTGRPYILTADRDEHIRVSRGLPAQAHIIDAFCLGHEDFVSRLCIPPSRPEILISGGGDDDVFVWNWAEGRLLSRASVLEQVQKVTPDATKVAVSRLFAISSAENGSTLIFVICERVPAVFSYELGDNYLRHSDTISTAGNPLDIASIDLGCSAVDRLLLAVDPQVSSGRERNASLIILEREPASSWRPSGIQKGALVIEDENIKLEELHKILYATESLRKTSDFE